MEKRPLNLALFTPYEHTAPAPGGVIRAPQNLWASLSDGLASKGHKVTLFAPSGSKTKAALPLNNLPPLVRNRSYEHIFRTDATMAVTKIFRVVYNQTAFADLLYSKLDGFDLVHAVFLPEILPLAATKKNSSILFTTHDPVTAHKEFIIKHYAAAENFYFNAISKSQKKLYRFVHYSAVVYNGIDIGQYKFYEKPPGDYLFFAGRMRQFKGPDIAIAVARRTGFPLLLAGERFPDEHEYWQSKVSPYLGGKIKYLGMQDFKNMPRLYGSAKVFLMPIIAPEPFGLVMVEAMAAGTPVIAFNKGSVPEVIRDGVTGYIVKNEAEMAKAVKKIYALPEAEYQKMRLECRKHVEQNFSLEKMVEGYERLYYKILGRGVR